MINLLFNTFILYVSVTFSANAMNESMNLLKVSCEKNGIPEACYNLANLLHRKDQKQEAEKYFILACKRDYTPACKRQLWQSPKTSSIKSEKKVNSKKRFLTAACANLFKSIADCSEFRCSQPNLLAPGLMVKHKVTSVDDYCKYTYDLTAGKYMVCFMDRRSSKAFRDRDEQEALELLASYRKNGICNEKEE